MDRFLGSFLLERSENFDEYLQTRGINWFLRKMMQMSSLTKEFTADDPTTATYSLANRTTTKTLVWPGWKLNEEFEAEGFDGKAHKIKFFMDGDALKEQHQRVDEEHVECYTYRMEGDYLVLSLEAEGIEAKRYLKRQVDESSSTTTTTDAEPK